MSRAPRPAVTSTHASPAQRLAWARRDIRFAADQFRTTGNPIWAWEAIGWSLAYTLPLPTWTRTYLSGVAREIGKLSRGGVPTKNAINRAVARAVGLTGHGRYNPFRTLDRPGHELLVAFEVYTYFNAHRHYRWDAVFADVAAAHRATCDRCSRISPGTVKRYWHRHALAVIPPHLVKRVRSQKVDDLLR